MVSQNTDLMQVATRLQSLCFVKKKQARQLEKDLESLFVFLGSGYKGCESYYQSGKFDIDAAHLAGAYLRAFQLAEKCLLQAHAITEQAANG